MQHNGRSVMVIRASDSRAARNATTFDKFTAIAGNRYPCKVGVRRSVCKKEGGKIGPFVELVDGIPRSEPRVSASLLRHCWEREGENRTRGTRR